MRSNPPKNHPLETISKSYWKSASKSGNGDLVFIGMRYYSRVETDKWTVVYKFAYEDTVVSTRHTYFVTAHPEKTGFKHNNSVIKELPNPNHKLVLKGTHEAYESGYHNEIPGANDYTPDNFYDRHPEDIPYWETYIEKFLDKNKEGRFILSINPEYQSEITIKEL